MIEKLYPNPINLQASSVYPFNEFSLQELLNKFFQTINECVESSNTALNFVKWLKEEGLPPLVEKEIEDMYNDGRLEALIDKYTKDLEKRVTVNEKEIVSLQTQIDDNNDETHTVVSKIESEINKTNQNVSENTKHLTELSINVMNYGAIGDGITDDTKSIEKALLELKDNVNNYLLFPQGYVFKCNFEITKPNVKIMGGGTIDGNITIFIQNIISDFQIEDITLKGNNPIHFKRCRGGAIRKCRFYDNNISILFKANEGEQGQTISRIQISDNVFDNNNYIIKQEQITSSKLSLADFHFINNVCKWANYSHIDLQTCDGFIIKGNTFFTNKSTITVKHHIKVSDWSSWCIIEGNNLFESGAESIWLNGVDNFNISGNNFAWCGRRERVGAIRISNPTYKRVYSLINNNNISIPSQCGIQIENSAYINIKNNFITLEEMENFEGVEPLDNNKFYGVYITNNTENRLNLSIDNHLSRRNKQTNPTNEIVSPNNFQYIDVNETVDELNGYYDEIRITKDCNINSIINGYQTKRLIIYCYANVIIENTSTIKLRNDRNIKMSLRDSITLLYKDGIWIELNRNDYVTSKVLVSSGESVIDLINDETIIRLNNETLEVIITNFTNGYNGKQITIISNGSNNKIETNTNIKLKDSERLIIPNGRSLTLIYDKGIWYEVGRSFV